jgi:hypothetical protein
MIEIDKTQSIPLFPTAVLKNNFGRKFTKKELDFVKENQKNITKNEGNTTSANRNLFDNKILKDLHNESLKMVDYYLKTIVCPKYEVSSYVTQAWLNFTEPGQYHHRHTHANSYLSGVIYINAEKEDKIQFYKSVIHEHIKLSPDSFNTFNSESWWIPVETGDIIVFPSSLMHSVELTESKNTRISLSFNTFLKGTIGDPKSLTELIIK